MFKHQVDIDTKVLIILQIQAHMLTHNAKLLLTSQTKRNIHIESKYGHIQDSHDVSQRMHCRLFNEREQIPTPLNID